MLGMLCQLAEMCRRNRNVFLLAVTVIFLKEIVLELAKIVPK